MCHQEQVQMLTAVRRALITSYQTEEVSETEIALRGGASHGSRGKHHRSRDTNVFTKRAKYKIHATKRSLTR